MPSPNDETIPVNRPYFTDEDRREILRETDRIITGGILTMGPWVERLERETAKKIGVRYAIATNSGTSALEVLCRYFNVSDGDEVIIPTNTFVATANAVRLAGGKPVLTDINAATLAIDTASVVAAMSPRTKGVIAVHIAGMISPDFESLRGLCRERKVFLIEDAAHAFGAGIPAGKAGALADGAAFSLFPTKPVTSGEGGLILTEDSACAEFARSYRCHGIDTNASVHRFIRLGHNFRMSEITALIGVISVRRNEESTRLRDKVAQFYRKALADSPCTVPVSQPDAVNAWFKFPLILPPGCDGARVRAQCASAKVMCNTCYWPPVHRQPYYASAEGSDPIRFPVAEDILNRTIALPIFPELSLTGMQRVTDTIMQAVDREVHL